jgi:hypothetical protein
MTMLAVSPEVGRGRNVRDHRYPGEEPHTPLPRTSNSAIARPETGAISNGRFGERGRQMPVRRFISLVCALAMAVCSCGHAIAEEQPPVPAPLPIERPEAPPRPPEVQTFAVCGVGAECGCNNVVSVAQARDGQSCTVTSSTGSCTFTSRDNDVGVCCVCRP